MASFIMVTTDNTVPHDFAQNPCGTTCCIAGAVVMFNELDYTNVLPSPQKRTSFQECVHSDDALVVNHGMDLVDAETMFYRTSSDIRPAHAAAVIRHWIETGDVDWDVPFVDPSLPVE